MHEALRRAQLDRRVRSTLRGQDVRQARRAAQIFTGSAVTRDSKASEILAAPKSGPESDQDDRQVRRTANNFVGGAMHEALRRAQLDHRVRSTLRGQDVRKA